MADTGLGSFAPLSPKMADFLKGKTCSDYIFEIGETVKVKESQFRVEQIGQHALVLRLIPDDSFQQIPSKR